MMMTIKHVERWKDRHGNVRLYYRRTRPGPRVALRGPEGSPEFWEDYLAASESRGSTHQRGTIRWLVSQYVQSAAFKGLEKSSQRVRRGILDRFCEKHGDKRYSVLRPKHLRRIRDKMADRPEAANGLLKALRQVFRWAVEDEEMNTNPAMEVSYLDSKNRGGFHSWSPAEVEQFEDKHPVGTKARLALALLLYTGQRRGDVVKMGKQHVRDGWMAVTQQKTGKRLEIPVVAELQRIIDASPCGDLTYLVTQFGKGFTSNGFGNWFRKQCDAAGLPHCSAHGVRKATATTLAHRGCTVHEIASITGHDSLREVQRYTLAADQKRLAGEAGKKMNKAIDG